MKISANVLINHIERAAIGTLINEMVLNEDLTFAVTDDARSVLSICNKSLGKSDFGKIGIYDLGLMIRTIQYSSTAIFNADEELDISVVENRLVFKKGDNEFKFLLSNPKVISSTIENPEEVLIKLRSKDAIQIVLDKKDIDSILQAIALITPEIVDIKTDGKKVLCLIGKDTEHNTNIRIGSFNEGKDISLKFKPDLISKVLDTVKNCENVKLELRAEYPAIFETGDYTLVMAPVKE